MQCKSTAKNAMNLSSHITVNGPDSDSRDPPIISKQLANRMIFLVVRVLSDRWPNKGPESSPLRLNADRARPRK